MQEINAYIYGKKIGTMIEHEGRVYFEYEKEFKLEGLEISPLKLHTTKTKDAYSNYRSNWTLSWNSRSVL